MFWNISKDIGSKLEPADEGKACGRQDEMDNCRPEVPEGDWTERRLEDGWQAGSRIRADRMQVE